MKNMIIVLSGPSGAGKGSIYSEIAKKKKNVFRYVSVTTRQPRPGEVDGRDYIFVTVEEFKEMVMRGEFFETNFYNGNYYGTPKPNLTNFGDKDVFFDLNAEGGMKIKELYPNAILFYIMPPTLNQLKKQMGNRDARRIELAKDEIEVAQKFDWLIVNKNSEIAADEIITTIEFTRKNSLKNSWNKSFFESFY